MSIQPPSDKLNVSFTDTLSINTYCAKDDSVLSDETSTNMLGSINDPIFGKSNAGFVTQFTLPTANLSFAGATLDSVVLSLAYLGSYGDTLTPMNIHVYELTEDITKAATYYSNRVFQSSATDLANNKTIANTTPRDSVLVAGVKYPPHLRIKLDNSLGQKIFNASTDNLASTANFQTFFKGLKVEASTASGNGSILYFDLLALNAMSKLTLYYKNDTVPASYSFTIDANCARVNHFTHDYSTANLINAQFSDHSQGQNLSYIQSMAGLKVHIDIPNIMKLANLGSISINKAELIINSEETTSNVTAFPVPASLALVGIDNSGNSTYILDQYEAASYYGGTYNSTKKQYTFNIARHLQEVLSGKINNNGLSLLVSGSTIKGDRLVIHGGGKVNPSAMRLKLTYTKIK